MAAARVVGPSGQAKYGSAATALTSGGCIVVGERVGVINGVSPIAAGDPYTVEFSGIYELDALSTDVWDDGAILYWDDSNDRLTDTASSHKTAGIAVGAKISGTTRASVDLNASVGSITV